MPRSQWSDYDVSLLSEGGGVFERKSKLIHLSKEAMVLLHLEEADVKPDHLIHHILKFPADLLWFGGIGTYVKDHKENDSDVGDRANDSVRVNGGDIRARVIAEGANLALTQRGRIAYALAGGKLNRDSVDNSGGVDCSDHEVNIKILFQSVLKSGQLTEEGRDALLKEMTREVGLLVVRNNYLQTQAISVIESRGAKVLARQNRLIRFFESQGRFNRDQESLPSEEEVEQRLEKKIGLTRPEISVLVSHAKLYLHEHIMASTLPENPLIQNHLMAYFPSPLQDQYPSFIREHPLRRELIATTEANLLVNRLGATTLFELTRRLHKSLTDIIFVFVQVRYAFGLEFYWKQVEALDGKVECALQNRLFCLLISFSEKLIEWAIIKGLSEFETERESQQNHENKLFGVQEKKVEHLEDFVLKLTIEDATIEAFLEGLMQFREIFHG